MEIKEADRIVIAKPVPSRPSYSSFRSFSELLAGAINSSPPNACPETAISPIRPKTVRFKPTTNRAPTAISSQAELSGAGVSYPSDKVDKASSSDIKSTVVYKPLAKVVSKTTLSLLANLGNSSISHQQTEAHVEARVHEPLNQTNYPFRSDLGSNLSQNLPSQSNQQEKPTEPSKTVSQNMEDDQKYLPIASIADRPSYDGYNWRKYGQKQVKGSEYPRSYYKCTYPNCPVKKKVERSLDGQIAEIVYKGEHNHPKPRPPKRNTSEGQETNNPPWNSQTNERNEGFEGRVENHNEVGLSTPSAYSGKALFSYDPVAPGAITNGLGTPENSCGVSGDCEQGSKGVEPEDDEPKSKRRKNENESGISGEAVQEPRVPVQNSTDSEIVGDGFRWRKYGQKVVKGNPYPRSYYRCTNLKCTVRKHVERASDDPTAFITTYEGKHNHDMPIKTPPNPSVSEPDSQVAAAAATSKDKP